MKKALLLALFLLSGAMAINVTISANPANGTLYLQGKEYTFEVAVKNNANTTELYSVSLETDGTDVKVNNTNRYVYSLNLTAGATDTTSVKVQIGENMSFSKTRHFDVYVYDEYGGEGFVYLEVKTPGFGKIDATLDYEPLKGQTATLEVSGETSNGEKTERFNSTYFVRNSQITCASNTTELKKFAINFTECPTGLYDIRVEGSADGHVRTKTFYGVYIYRNLTVTAQFFRVEEFGFERPLEEVERIAGLDQLRLTGTAFYDDGTVLGNHPDTRSKNYIKMQFNNLTHALNPSNSGDYSIYFTAPRNTSKYPLVLTAYAHGGHELKLEYDITVNNTKDYSPEEIDAGEIMGNLAFAGNQTLFGFENGELSITAELLNDNFVSVTGKMSLAEPSGRRQFVVYEPPIDSVLGKKARNYTIRVVPKPYTRPGSYPVSLSFGTAYGRLVKQLVLVVPPVEIEPGKVNFFRYVDYSEQSKVSILLANPTEATVNATIREEIDKNAIPSLVKIADLLGLCNETDHDCRLQHVLANGSCFDCSLVGGNLTENCTANCTNRTQWSFSPEYTRIIDIDPVVEWDVFMEPNSTLELSYTISKLAEPEWFSEPAVSILEMAYPAPAATPVPEPTPDPVPEPTPEPEPEKAPMWLFLIFGMFLSIVAVFAFVAYLFLKKRKMVDEFFDKYLPAPKGPTEEDHQREELRRIFISEEHLKQQEKEASEKKPLPSKEKRPGLLENLNKALSPRKKEEGQTVHTASPEKNQQMDSLKNIGKGFGEGD